MKTLLCWLFGHKWSKQFHRPYSYRFKIICKDSSGRTKYKCIHCGSTKAMY